MRLDLTGVPSRWRPRLHRVRRRRILTVRVVLRNPLDADASDYRHSLTVGQEYEVLGIEGDFLRLLTDAGEPVLFDPACFEVTDPAEPKFWVSTIGEEGERYAYPIEWAVPGFFEDWHDRVDVVRRIFSAQLAAWYPHARSRSEPDASAADGE